MTVAHQCGKHLVEDTDFAARRNDLVVNSELSIFGHGILQEVWMITTLTQHHVHIGEFDIKK